LPPTHHPACSPPSSRTWPDSRRPQDGEQRRHAHAGREFAKGVFWTAMPTAIFHAGRGREL